MRPTDTILILALSWAVQVIASHNSSSTPNEDEERRRIRSKTEARLNVRQRFPNVEEEETETTEQEEETGGFGYEYETYYDEVTERDTYRDVCTGYIEGGGNIMHTTTCPESSTCCFGGGFVTCRDSEVECMYFPDETAPSSSEETEGSKSNALSTGGIIGIAVSAGCSVLGLIFTVAFKIWKHRRKAKEDIQNGQGYN
ncbi:hypothetical protein CEP54_009748 [Fusarium duplospermum]|uniref:Uncharacterized protein n=1 Tax=Fusarium duplospermum TaxID=1325734 RepID=A0A428PNZ2_9HYPO|nr:hypothetical protein CEP54_009748 [Fusarium duplospermum]